MSERDCRATYRSFVKALEDENSVAGDFAFNSRTEMYMFLGWCAVNKVSACHVSGNTIFLSNKWNRNKQK